MYSTRLALICTRRIRATGTSYLPCTMHYRMSVHQATDSAAVWNSHVQLTNSLFSQYIAQNGSLPSAALLQVAGSLDLGCMIDGEQQPIVGIAADRFETARPCRRVYTLHK
jgi:hypothetical protein